MQDATYSIRIMMMTLLVMTGMVVIAAIHNRISSTVLVNAVNAHAIREENKRISSIVTKYLLA